MAWQAASDAASKYNAEVNLLNSKYGDPGEWLPAIVKLMNQWQNDNIKLAAAAAAACAHATPGTTVKGPVANPG